MTPLQRHIKNHGTRPQKACSYCQSVRAFDDSGKLIVRDPAPAPTFVCTKVTVLGPAPWGGSTTATLDHDILDLALANGGTISRVWNVYRRFDGSFFSEDVR